jgi:prepilin-type N-terminal cleavage/methylation domain-containing protein
MPQEQSQSMKKEALNIKPNGFSLVEIILSISIFALLVTALIGAYLYGEESTAISGTFNRAAFIADQSFNVLRNMRDSAFSKLENGVWGLALGGNYWYLKGGTTTFDIFNDSAVISSIDDSRKQVTVNVAWSAWAGRSQSTSITARLTNWRSITQVTGVGGMMVYTNGLDQKDEILYKVMSPSGSWSAENLTADLGYKDVERVLTTARVYSSPIKNEYILLSKHYDGGAQYIYAQVYDGDNDLWGNVVLLSAIKPDKQSYEITQDFDGTYLNNGDFMAVYSDGTPTPQYNVWMADGHGWTGPIPMEETGDIPTYIVARARPGTDEVMVAQYGIKTEVYTQYYDGTGYGQKNWIMDAHSPIANDYSYQVVDFAWSRHNPTLGSLVYVRDYNMPVMTAKIIKLEDGKPKWVYEADAPLVYFDPPITALSIDSSPIADEFMACQKDLGGKINCAVVYENGGETAWRAVDKGLISTHAEVGPQRSFHFAYQTDGNGIIVYGEAAHSVPALKKLNASGGFYFDEYPTDLIDLESKDLTTARLMSEPNFNDTMILMANKGARMYSAVWDGNNKQLYTTPAGKAFQLNAIKGYSIDSFWYDFAWDLSTP